MREKYFNKFELFSVRKLFFIIILFAVYALFCCVWFSFVSYKTLAQSDALVLLAGNMETRTPAAAALYHQKHAPKLLLTNDGVLSRWSPKHQRNLYNIEWTQEMLTRSGVPATSIIKLPYAASGTVHDARAVRAYLQSHPVNSLLLVTSDYHANRALWVFKRVLHDMPVRIDVAASESGWSSVVPILLEPLKQVYYRIRFGWFGLPV